MTKYHDRIELLYDARLKKYIVIGLSGLSPEMDLRFWLKPSTGSTEINSFLPVN
jgi:hypothetical protein